MTARRLQSPSSRLLFAVLYVQVPRGALLLRWLRLWRQPSWLTRGRALPVVTALPGPLPMSVLLLLTRVLLLAALVAGGLAGSLLPRCLQLWRLLLLPRFVRMMWSCQFRRSSTRWRTWTSRCSAAPQ